MSGLELSRILRASFPSIKVLIISGYNEFTLAQQAIEYQVKGFLLKPIKQENLEQALTKLLIELDGENDTVQASVPEHLKNMSKEEIVSCIEKYLQENFRKQITMGEISDRLGFAPDYARQLLIRHPELEVSIIGEMSGYPDPVYFSKVFKKNTGIWPSQYRSEKGAK